MSRHDEVAHLFAAQRPARSTPITEADLAPLPEPVQRYLRYSGVIGKVPPQSIRLKQEGALRTGENWMPMTAEQYYTTTPPAFLWYASVHAAPLVTITGRDEYAEGHGHMLIKLMNLLPIVNAQGAEIDQGTMLRYLGEITWFPTGWFNDYITWEAVDDLHSRVHMDYAGMKVSAVLTFDSEGRLLNFEAERYRDMGGGKSELRHWMAPTGEYGELAGLRIPVAGEGVWRMDDGDFSYFRYRLTSLELDVPAMY